MDEKEKRPDAEAPCAEKPVPAADTQEDKRIIPEGEVQETEAQDTEAEVPETPEGETKEAPPAKGLSAKLDSIEAALEKPLLPVWNWFRGLGTAKRFLVSLGVSLLAACLVFLCFLPGILHTVERNRAAEAAALQAMEDAETERLAEELARAAEKEEELEVLQAIAEHKHELLSRFYASEYTIQLHSCTFTLSAADIEGLYTLQETQGGYLFVPDRDRIKEYMTGLCEEYEADPVAVKYSRTAETREQVYYPKKDTGFTPDIDQAVDRFASLILRSRGGAVEMEYYGSSYCESLWKKFKGTGLEVSIDNQYLWLYVDGKVVVETPIVSGNVWTGDSTPKGKYTIYWITTDTVLKGRTWNDHVDHWAPFFGNYGIHDAQWRDEFGGDIYKTDGSHGCINVPIDAMNEIASYYYVKMPIIIY